MTISSPAAFGAATPRQLAAFRAQLDEQRRFRLDQLEELRSIDPDNSSEVTEVLAAGARVALRDVLAALHRMDNGTYGTCTECGTRRPDRAARGAAQVAQCLRAAARPPLRAGGDGSRDGR